jgi:hypothetical protein
MINISTLAVGARGPAGGWIIYDKGNYSDGWRYLEVAPTDASTGIGWGCSGAAIGSTGTAIGAGKANTEVILSKCFEASFAAQAAKSYSYNGYNDWFLPSQDELNVIFQAKGAYGITGIAATDYWSSYETSSVNARYQNMGGGTQNTLSKTRLFSVRAIRAF